MNGRGAETVMNAGTLGWVTAGLVLSFWCVWAQAAESVPEMDHSKMDHAPASGNAPAPEHDMSGMQHGTTSMPGGAPPPGARDPHAYADGYDLGSHPLPHMGHRFGSLLVDRLESVRSRDNTSVSYDVRAWYGGDYDRAVFKAEGDVDGGETKDARTELLWSHAVAAYWDRRLGVRHDSGVGSERNWLAFGVQGLAPYWFEIDAAAYVGSEGRTALRLTAEYELLLTQRFILQPRIETNIYGKSDAERRLGAGLSDAHAGLRLRYEIRREFAPYIGIERVMKLGTTADLTQAAGEDAQQTRLVAGARFWF